ncbi:MAG: sigma-54 dependent transcriptional regulator [Patescibacteria group bacterium]
MPAELKARILVVDDHIEMARVLADQLTDVGHSVDVATSGTEALNLTHSCLPDIVIADLRMEGVDGLDVLDGVHEIDPTIPVMIMTAFGAIESAVEAIKRGAYHYFTKPSQFQEVRVYVERALAERRLREENRALKRIAQQRSSLDAMVGQSQIMRELYELVERVAPTGVPVLIRGESGSGKELVARALHFLSHRRDRTFVPVNCTALPEALLESELFGHLKGAFTGASTARRGLFVGADGGTLFFDEIGDMPINLQAKLLRVLEDGLVRAVGSDVTRKVNVRMIAATNQPIDELVKNGRFREDLFFRLNVVPIFVPALKQRPDDIPLLIEHFLTKAREENPGTKVARLSSELISTLAAQEWPGNVRELENLIKRLVIVGIKEVADMDDLVRHASRSIGLELTPLDAAKIKADPISLRQLESEYIEWVVKRYAGNKTRAAEILGIDVSTIHRRGKNQSPKTT